MILVRGSLSLVRYDISEGFSLSLSLVRCDISEGFSLSLSLSLSSER